MSNTTTEEGVRYVLQTILDDKEKYGTSLKYAIAYARAAMYMSGHELAVQCLYILNNITGWRHPKAAVTRQVLKDFARNHRRLNRA